VSINGTQSLGDEFSSVCIDLIFSDPFFGHFLLGFSREISDDGPTMWVRPGADDNVTIGINPSFWQEIGSKKNLRKGAVKHEVLHIVFKHLSRFLDTSHGIRTFDNQRLFNIAADLVVNQYIKSDWLIDGAVVLSMFSELKLEEKQDVHYYYNALRDFSNEMEQGKGHASKSWKNLKDLLEEGHPVGFHGFWREMAERSDASNTQLNDWVDRQIVNAINRLDSTNSWGDLPGGLVEYLKDFMQSRKPKVDWRRTLRLFTESSQHTYLTSTFKRPSKRYKTLATFPDGSPIYEMKDGKPKKDSKGAYIRVWQPKYPGLKIRQRIQLLVGIDTSASLDIDRDVPIIFNELNHLGKRGVDLLVVEIDTQIERIYSFPFPEEQLSISGRGGTDFNELLSYANGQIITHPVEQWINGKWTTRSNARLSFPLDGIIYFTDGYASTPSVSVHQPILWVLVGTDALSADDEAYARLPGQKVVIEAERG